MLRPEVLSSRETADRRAAVDEALASVRLEGVEPSPLAIRLLDEVVAGHLDEEQAIERLTAHYRR